MQWIAKILTRAAYAALLFGMAEGALARAEELNLANPPDKKGENVKPTVKSDEQPGISSAVMAAQLAFEGEKRKSPILLIAAAELLGSAQESNRPTGDVKGAGTSTSKDNKEAPKLNTAELLAKAKKLAEGDAAMMPWSIRRSRGSASAVSTTNKAPANPRSPSPEPSTR